MYLAHNTISIDQDMIRIVCGDLFCHVSSGIG